jgi:uncharacterized protein
MGISLIIFVKAPRLGTVKTRLARSLGESAALSAYCELVETLFLHLEDVREVELRFAPDDSQSEIQRWLKPGWQATPQGSGDLGDRLIAAFSDAFAAGATRVVVIGSDCPAVTPADIRAAWTALQMTDVVLGPALDGGYWLIGLRQPQPVLFEKMPWSTNAVLNETVERARAARLSVHLLRRLSDVDTERDWADFLKSGLSSKVT